MKKIIVYDAIMGSGKTYDAIERMNKFLINGEKFIYITPFKKEIKRVLDELKSDEVFTPLGFEEKGPGKIEITTKIIGDNGGVDLNAKPSFKSLNKRAQFLKMASEGKNIISTHSLFMNLKKGDYSMFNEYILILDEVVTPLKVINVGALQDKYPIGKWDKYV